VPDNVLVLAAHPDDEALGCGGTLSRHIETGDDVHILFLADGETSRGDTANVKERQDAARAAAILIGAEPPVFLGYPDNRMDIIPFLDIVQRVEVLSRDIKPTLVYTHHAGDLNIDHRIAHQVALTAFRPEPHGLVNAIYGFEVLSSTGWNSPNANSDFCPTRYVDISAKLEKKNSMLECYRNEMRKFPHARSGEAVVALAKYRGAMVGLEAAEAFTVIREIER
jgi:LmbE family N-acetylglucosaminyl deacetylase